MSTLPEPAEPPKTGEVPPSASRESAQVPVLTQLLSEQERWELNREIDELLFRINQVVTVLGQRPLAEEQMAVLDRVRAFVKQTMETRKSDLGTARNLARRAELLARDLEESTR